MSENGDGDLAAAVIEFRRRTGLTQAQLASQLDVTDRYIRAVEHGRSLGPASLRKLSRLIDRAGYNELARRVRKMALSEQDYRSLENKIGFLEFQVSELKNRIAILERRRPDRLGTEMAVCDGQEPKVPV